MFILYLGMVVSGPLQYQVLMVSPGAWFVLKQCGFTCVVRSCACRSLPQRWIYVQDMVLYSAVMSACEKGQNARRLSAREGRQPVAARETVVPTASRKARALKQWVPGLQLPAAVGMLECLIFSGPAASSWLRLFEVIPCHVMIL